MQTDWDDPFPFPFLTGVFLATNAIPDATLVVDGPNCTIFRASQIQGNHDWQSDLLRADGCHRVVDTDATPDRAAIGDDRLLRVRLRKAGELDSCRLLLLTSMSSVAMTGRSHPTILAELDPPPAKPVVCIPPGSLRGDWLHGYAWTLAALASELPLPDRPREKNTVAVVGYFWDRHEGDHQGNRQELVRCLRGLDLELVSLWLGGGGVNELQAVARAETIVSLPYGREAARRLAARTGATLVEVDRLPIGLESSANFIRVVAEGCGRRERAEACIEAELREVVPGLEWVLPKRMLHRRVVLVGDPHLAHAVASALDELGAELVAVVLQAEPSHVEAKETEGPGKRLVSPRPSELRAFLDRTLYEDGIDLLVGHSAVLPASLLAGPHPTGWLELGFPSYRTHFFLPQPFVGFRGVLGLVERCLHSLVVRDLAAREFGERA